MSENGRQSQTNVVINDKLQSTVVTFLRHGGIVNAKLRKVYCCVCQWKFFFYNWSSHALSSSFSSVVARHTKCSRQPPSCFRFGGILIAVIFYCQFAKESVGERFWKSVKLWQRYHHEYGVFHFVEHAVLCETWCSGLDASWISVDVRTRRCVQSWSICWLFSDDTQWDSCIFDNSERSRSYLQACRCCYPAFRAGITNQGIPGVQPSNNKSNHQIFTNFMRNFSPKTPGCAPTSIPSSRLSLWDVYWHVDSEQ